MKTRNLSLMVVAMAMLSVSAPAFAGEEDKSLLQTVHDISDYVMMGSGAVYVASVVETAYKKGTITQAIKAGEKDLELSLKKSAISSKKIKGRVGLVFWTSLLVDSGTFVAGVRQRNYETDQRAKVLFDPDIPSTCQDTFSRAAALSSE